MSREFNGSTQYLEYTGVPSLPGNISVSLWANLDDVASQQMCCGLFETATNDNFFRVGIIAAGNATARIQSTAGNRAAEANSSTTLSADTWHHIFGQFNNTSGESWTADVWLDDAGNGSGSDNLVSDVRTWTATGIGRWGQVTPADYVDGSVAEVAIWSVLLDAGERAALAAGASPLFIRPASLELYVPLLRDDDKDLVGGFEFTATGSPTVDIHPAVYYPSAPFVPFITTAAPGTVVQDIIAAGIIPFAR